MKEPIKEFRGGTSWLSNTFKCVIDTSKLIDFNLSFLPGLYRSVEHAYKSFKFDSQDWKYFCLTEKRPTFIITKSFEREGEEKISSYWTQDNRLTLMYKLNKIKYEQEVSRNMLINTTDREIIEGNYHGDKFWGVDIETGEGENMLGKILMTIRKELQ
jgi:predicted NAD-dependent protein-ADP-ribosyltransferase YbiA (DUF1768 family)